MPKGWDFRDVSLLLQKLREFLLGRKHNLHSRFPPIMSSRTIPPPDLPRGPKETQNYSNQYYYQRSAMDSVKPPVVAPVAEGLPFGQDPKKKSVSGGGGRADALCFSTVPTPGTPWWWDGHCYFECADDPPPPAPVCPPPKEDKCKQATEEKK